MNYRDQWLVLLLVSCVANAGRDPVDRKRRFSNTIGFVVFAIFVMAILIVGAVRAIKSRGDLEAARKTANEVASAFAEDDVAVIDKWSRGEYVDPWQNQPVLVSNGKAGVQVASKGPDGKLGTDDDVLSDLLPVKEKVAEIPDLPEESSSMKDRAIEWLRTKFDKRLD